MPMTSSLYVPGRLVARAEVLVDIGAGFYVGKPPADACAILSRRGGYVKSNTDSLAKVITQRRENMQVLGQFISERRNAAAASAGGEGGGQVEG